MLAKRGAQIQLFNLINRLPAYVKVSVFSFSNEKTYPEFTECERIKFYTSPYNGRYNPLKAISLFRCLYRKEFDVAITLGLGTSLFIGRIGAVICSIPIIYTTLHQFRRFNTTRKGYFEFPNILLNRLLPKLAGRRIFRFLPVSEKLSKKIMQTLTDYPVQTLNNGIAFEDINALPSYQPNAIIQSIAADLRQKLTIVQVGSLDENKNHIFTLELIKELKHIFPDILYLIIGTGKTKQTLETWVRSKGLQSHVRFSDRIDRMDCLYLISRSKVLVLTSRSEAFPNVLVEAQATSVPVVTFDVGGASEIVENYITGYVVKEDDRAAFISAITKLLKNNKLRTEMSVMGKQRALAHFTIEKKIEKLLSLIESDLPK